MPSLIDLSHEIYHRMPTYPTHAPVTMMQWGTHAELKQADEVAFSSASMFITLGDHAGTHVDAPAHFDADPEAMTVVAMPLERFYTSGLCLDLSHLPLKSDITVEHLEEAERASGERIGNGDTVLLYTGFNDRVPSSSPGLFTDFSGLVRESAIWLGEKGIVSFGVEAISPGRPGRNNYLVHQVESKMTNKLTLSVWLVALVLMYNGALAADKVTFQTDWIPSGEHAAYYGAWEKGIYADHDIDITITRGYGSGDTVTKLAAGGFDFGVADVGALLTARAREGVPVKAISTLYTHSPHSLFVLKSSGITNFSDLDGKRIGITPGNSHRVYFPHIAEQAGTDPDSIRWVNMDGGAMAVQLIAKNIDAAPFYAMHHYFQNKAAKAAGEEIVVLPFVDAGFAIYAAALIASDETIKERPELVKRFLAATHEAWRWARDNPEEACTLHVKRVPEVQMDDCMGSLTATLKYVFNDHTEEVGVGNTDDERIAATWEAVAEANDLDPSWDPHQAFDTSLLPVE